MPNPTKTLATTKLSKAYWKKYYYLLYLNNLPCLLINVSFCMDQKAMERKP